MKLFLVIPGHVTSINDWEEHFISAGQLIHLYKVDPRECIIWDYRQEISLRGFNDTFLDQLHVLRPLTNGHLYTPIRPAEREAAIERVSEYFSRSPSP